MSRIRIKDASQAELQHTLAHLWLAIDYLVDSQYDLARHELDGIEGLIFFDDDDDRAEQLKGDRHGTKEPMQESQTQAEAKT